MRAGLTQVSLSAGLPESKMHVDGALYARPFRVTQDAPSAHLTKLKTSDTCERMLTLQPTAKQMQ